MAPDIYVLYSPVQDASPLVSMTPGSPIENPYLFAAGSNPSGVGSINMGSNLRPTQFIQQQPHQPQQQMPAIISLDANRYLISGRPVVCDSPIGDRKFINNLLRCWIKNVFIAIFEKNVR